MAPLSASIEFGALLGNKAFGSNWITEERNQRGAKVAISQMPQRISPIDVDPELYKRRHLIENFFGKLEEFKRIAMRACKTDQSSKPDPALLGGHQFALNLNRP